MDRNEFLKICGGACLGLVGSSLVLQGCQSARYAQGTIRSNRLQIPKSDFEKPKKNKTKYRKYVLVQTDTMDFPVVVYRSDEATFTALLLRCTHQGNELSVTGNILTCSAHGSEFNNYGEVIQGPAEQNLKSYPVTTDEKFIYLELS